MKVKVNRLKKKATHISGTLLKLPVANGSPLPITTGWIVRKMRIERKVSGTLMKPTMPYTAPKRARRAGSSTPWRSKR